LTINQSLSPALALLAADNADLLRATELSRQLGLPLAPLYTDPATCLDFDALLVVSGPHLSLQQTTAMSARSERGLRQKPPRRQSGRVLPGPVTVDFGSDAMRHRRRSGHNELLGKAVGVSSTRHPRVLDTTAGLGRDAFVLADMGCPVTLCEREPVIAALLASGLEVAQATGQAGLQQVVARLQLFAGDALFVDPSVLATVDVICLDPMFPQRGKSAAVKKEMALFQALLESNINPEAADELLQWALQQDVARVVVKRPARAPSLGRLEPSHNVTGKAVRFDVYVKRALG
jgi:16S rRNA (guanine1516-N2)-methyltransferase